MALLIRSNGRVKELDHYPKYDEVCKLIDGNLEYITLRDVNIEGVNYMYLYTNEDGNLLPINNVASALAGRQINGNAVLFNLADKQRDMSGL